MKDEEIYQLLKPFVDPENVRKMPNVKSRVVISVPRAHWERASKAFSGLAVHTCSCWHVRNRWERNPDCPLHGKSANR